MMKALLTKHGCQKMLPSIFVFRGGDEIFAKPRNWTLAKPFSRCKPRACEQLLRVDEIALFTYNSVTQLALMARGFYVRTLEMVND